MNGHKDIQKSNLPKHNHGEAFKLMTYKCSACGFREAIWNSRDGVTPFALMCPECGEPTLEHVDWHKDVYSPDYTPVPGQRVFIDLPESLKPPLARCRVAAFAGTPYEVKAEDYQEVLEEVVNNYRPGEPYIITWR